MGNVIKFPEIKKDNSNERTSNKELSNWLREIIDHLERGELQTDPFAISVILAGEQQIEFLSTGYKRDFKRFKRDSEEYKLFAHRWCINRETKNIIKRMD